MIWLPNQQRSPVHPEAIFSLRFHGKVLDGTTLTWVNDGGYTAATSFDFGIRNATIDIAYLPPSVINTRATTTDKITLPLTQNLAKVQVRYGLTSGGEIKMYEVWVEATAG
jgi:hypothetical protein